MIVINRMDADNIDFPTLIENIQELFGKACVLFNVPLGQGADFRGVASTLKPPADTAGALMDPAEIGESLLESIIEVDEAVTERYFEGTPPTDEEIARLIVKAVAQGSLVPIVCVSGKTGAGLPELLDALALCALPPDVLPRMAKNAAGEEVEIKADPAGPLVAQVFKTRIDPFVQKLSFIRVFSGTLKKDATVPVVGARKPVKLSALFNVQANETEPVDEVGPGGIVAVAKVEELHTGSSPGRVDDAADPLPHADGRPGRQSPRAAATKASSPAPCRRSARRTPPSAAISIRRPRKWSSPA